MIGINSTFNNSFVNLNIKNNNNSSLNSNTSNANVKNLQDTQDTTVRGILKRTCNYP